ncbi:ferritin-like domain-containing protein [Deinococcus sp. 23YEL01]|uniref:ferritin-like domain-containing protein n=1 Tax=Deinococcus sp. 23YEL01 TaxID=2745871 RepID=UPI001E517D4D|nr:ferritin-like domain-containing protein [Deinococcus sp. 23YEL01]MCD0168301.1 ferritin-like domain-containing protein [Deinococcus sp. 23YEL01]
MPDDTQITSAVNSTSRRQFMGYAALFGGGMALVSCSVTLPPKTAAEQQDIDILNYALTLEYLEAEFYSAFIGSGPYASKLTDPRVIEYAKEIAAHEISHVEALKKTIDSLGGKFVAKPTFDFSPLIGNATVNDQLFLQLAAVLEPVGVRAYLGQVARLSNPQLIAAAAAIHAVEANHVSAVQELRVELRYNTAPTRQTDIAPQSAAKPTSTAAADFDANYSPTPTAFWKALTMAEVLAIVKPVIK